MPGFDRDRRQSLQGLDFCSRVGCIRSNWNGSSSRNRRHPYRCSGQSPQGVKELIPAANLIPEDSPAIMIVETPFPPDDRSSGYERGTSVSKEWDEATTYAAIEIADKFVAALPRLIDDKGERDDKAADFCCTVCRTSVSTSTVGRDCGRPMSTASSLLQRISKRAFAESSCWL